MLCFVLSICCRIMHYGKDVLRIKTRDESRPPQKRTMTTMNSTDDILRFVLFGTPLSLCFLDFNDLQSKKDNTFMKIKIRT